MATSNNKNVSGWTLINMNNNFMYSEKKLLLFLLISCKFVDILLYIILCISLKLYDELMYNCFLQYSYMKDAKF